MHLWWVNVRFYDAVNIIHDVITTPNPFSYTLNSCMLMLEIMKLNKSDVERKIEYVHSAVLYQKYLTWLGEMIILSPRLENYQLDIFDIRQYNICILYVSCSV